MSKYLFQRGSAPILQWRHGIPPRARRAADNVALGYVPDMTIVPGGPEPIAGIADTITQNFSSFGLGLVVGMVAYRLVAGR